MVVVVLVTWPSASGAAAAQQPNLQTPVRRLVCKKKQVHLN